MCNPERLAENVLPRYFRHTQYSSWVRTLNHYSFRKTRPGQWANPHFQRDKPELLQYVKRNFRAVRAEAPETLAALSTNAGLMLELVSILNVV